MLLYGKNPTDHGRVVGEEQRDLDGDEGSAEVARHLVADAFARWDVPDETGVGAQCVSEVVTGLCAGRPERIELRIRCGEHSVRLLLRPHGAERAVHDLLSDESAGLHFTVVDRMAPFWGVLARPSGEVVWLEFARETQSRQ